MVIQGSLVCLALIIGTKKEFRKVTLQMIYNNNYIQETLRKYVFR